MSPDETLRFYDDNAVDYATDASGKIQRRQVRMFAKGLLPGAHVLDLGSGGGHDARTLIDLGFDVTLVDGSAGLAKEAEKRTGRNVRVLRFEDLDYSSIFDGVWASASLHHVQSQALPGVFDKVAAALVPNGLLFASFKEGEADRHDRLGRFYCAMSSDRLCALTEASGLIVDTIERGTGHGYDGVETNWLSLTARKNA